jgi:hypothetical protein
MDQPRHALDMITRFTRNQPLHNATAAPHAAAGRKALPGASWRLRRAMPSGDASLHAATEQ